MAWTAVPTYAVGDPWTAAAVNTYIRDNLNYLADSSGRLRPTATDHFFGQGATGGTGADVHLIGDATTAYIYADGTPTNVALWVRAKGTGGLHVQDGTGADGLAIQTPNSALTSGQTAIITLAYHNGTAVTQQRVTVGAADSGGTGFKLLRVPN